MIVLLQLLYWIVLLATGGGIGLITFLMLFNAPRAVPFRDLAVIICSGLVSGGLLWWAVQTGAANGRWLAGILICLLAAVVFAAMMVGGFLAFAKIRWQ